MCKPTTAHILLTRKRHIALCGASTGLIVASSVGVFLRKMYENNIDGSIPTPALVSTVVEFVLLFVIPASASTYLYANVGRVLRKAERNVKQNSLLNKAFAVTCFAWVLMWTPHEVTAFLYNLRTIYQAGTENKLFYFILVLYKDGDTYD